MVKTFRLHKCGKEVDNVESYGNKGRVYAGMYRM
jgi:hypothetical protein